MKASVLDHAERRSPRAVAPVASPPISVSADYTDKATRNPSDEIARDFETCGALADEWDALALSLHGDVYATFDWCRIWWRHYGGGRELAVHVLRDDAALRAIVPMFIESLGVGPMRIRVARLVGCDHSVTTCGVVCAEGDLPWVMRQIAEDCRAANCDAIQLGPLSGDDGSAASLVSALGETDYRVVKRSNRHPHMLFDVPSDFEAFMEQLSTKERRNLRRDERKLAERGTLARRLITDGAEITPWLDHFIDAHQEQWRAQGQLGHFDDWPESRAFHHELASCQHAKGRLLLTDVAVNDATVAMEYSYQFGDRVHWILGARSEDASGRIGFSALMGQAIERKATRIDALRGYYEYKRLLGATCRQQCVVVAARPEVLRRARLAGFACASQAWDRLYYRLWFSRLRPRLGLPGRPLSKTWIRSRM